MEGGLTQIGPLSPLLQLPQVPRTLPRVLHSMSHLWGFIYGALRGLSPLSQNPKVQPSGLELSQGSEIPHAKPLDFFELLLPSWLMAFVAERFPKVVINGVFQIMDTLVPKSPRMLAL